MVNAKWNLISIPKETYDKIQDVVQKKSTKYTSMSDFIETELQKSLDSFAKINKGSKESTLD